MYLQLENEHGDKSLTVNIEQYNFMYSNKSQTVPVCFADNFVPFTASQTISDMGTRFHDHIL